MTRRFKSTITDWYAVEDDNSIHVNLYDGEGDYRAYIPKSMVENSDDWREITEKPILVTEDGVEAFELDNIWKVDSNGLNIVGNCPCKSNLTTLPERFKFFAYQENAEAYIEQHKPRYSNEDLEWLAEQIEMYVDRASDKVEMKAQAKCFIHDLEDSKKH